MSRNRSSAATARSDQALYSRIYHLPSQLERARARGRQLEAEARRYGMHDLVGSQ